MDKFIDIAVDALVVIGTVIVVAVASVKPLPGKGGFTCGRVEQVSKAPSRP